MSRKIVVLPEQTQLSKGVVARQIRRNLMAWVIVNVSAQRLPVPEFRHAPKLPVLRQKHFIPDDLPPYEVSGCIFDPPEPNDIRSRQLIPSARAYCRNPALVGPHIEHMIILARNSPNG